MTPLFTTLASPTPGREMRRSAASKEVRLPAALDARGQPANIAQTMYETVHLHRILNPVACVMLLLPLRAATPVSSSAIALSPDAATVFLVNSDSNSVSSIDTLADQKLAETTVGNDPRSLAISPDGSVL